MPSSQFAVRLSPRLVATMVTCLLVGAATPALAASAPAPVPTISSLAETRALLGADVRYGVVSSATSASLTPKLDAAVGALSRGDKGSAQGQVGAFVNAVQAQRGKAIATVAANALIAVVQGGTPPATTSIAAGAAATVVTIVGGTPVVVEVPA